MSTTPHSRCQPFLCSGRSLACPELRRARPDAGRDRCLWPQRRSCARPLGFPGTADLPIGSWVSPISALLPVALASRPELRRVMSALLGLRLQPQPFPTTISVCIPLCATSWVLFVGTAFRGGPPTKVLGYSITDHAIPNELTNPSSVPPSSSALSANLRSLCVNLFSSSLNSSTSKVTP